MNSIEMYLNVNKLWYIFEFWMYERGLNEFWKVEKITCPINNWFKMD